MSSFTHLHVHTQYSTLDGASQIPALVDKAIADGMTAVAITDHGNMYGVKEFFNYIKKKNEKVEDETKRFKPIIGCEVYMSPASRFEKMKYADKPSRYHLILLAKNKTGYRNLAKLVSLGFTEGFYGKPRIDRELLEKYREGLIVTSACIAGEIPRKIAAGNIPAAEETILWFKTLFADDFYIELQRHKTNKPGGMKDVFEKQQKVNPVLVDLAKKHGIKCIASNDVHFVNESEADAHERLLCISTGAKLTDEKRMRYTKQEWFKTQAEMNAIFADMPEVLSNTNEIADKVEYYDIDHKPIMPNFPLPEGFTNDDDYLRYLTNEGAKKRYPNIDSATQERIDFELEVIKNMGFPGYFLIVQDFIAAARNMGVSVGPGRGSAAGSVVAYCLRITDIDPLKYDLLFERFLNPDRISLPDIDIDFDDDGRGKVLQWVSEKYGRNCVAGIVTFGTMAAKSAIKDVARVEDLSLNESNRLSKLIDEIPRDKKVNIKTAIETVPAMREALNSDDPLIAETIKYAQMLEGTVRQTGVHACGTVIGHDDLSNYIPISATYDKDGNVDQLVAQYEGAFIEEVGMIKMDFLGLKTLSIITEALSNIKLRNGIDIDIDTIPIDDAPTYELYSKGETTGTFQFESDGMKKYLRELKPTKFEDLIAMNALYRPGPMDYIPDFIDRKSGRKPIVYDIPIMEERLKDTYGITVYQEQVMLLSRDLAGFTRGQSDELRKAMGKKIIEKLVKLKPKFLDGCKANGYDEKIVEKIWADWEKFASYAFNKSHATCYSWVAYQTAYLKANYPPEYMAAVLSRSISNITDITKFMDECRRMGIEVLGPDVNESNNTFTVNKQGNIRFGLGAIKGVGSNAVAGIVEERNKTPFKDVFDFVERVNLQACNKKTLEALAQAGAFDNLPGVKREHFFADTNPGETFTDVLLRFGNKMQTSKEMMQNSLFGGSNAIAITRPEIPKTEDWSILEKLNREKDLIGIYLSAHPLDPFRLEMEQWTNMQLVELQDINRLEGREFSIAGLVTAAKDAIGKTGKPWGALTLEDFSGSYEFRFFGKDHDAFHQYLHEGYPLFIKGSIQKNFRQELEPKITRISYLSSVREDLLKSVSLLLPLESISDAWMTDLSSLVDAHQGKTKLKFRIFDKESNQQVELFSRKQRIDLNNDLVTDLEKLGVEFKLN
ncbi:MAG: DNA polymerase III subunit alpha [Bacteroidales bacterium]|jgi:DNA polymerase-3 subunit alpha|nr:DNA polymerase III subunit alpha [Bacteroidales bacterium]